MGKRESDSDENQTETRIRRRRESDGGRRDEGIRMEPLETESDILKLLRDILRISEL